MATDVSGLSKEVLDGMSTNRPINNFQNRLAKSRENLINFLTKVKKEGKVIMGYGASTKGNVLLQFCNIDQSLLPLIGDKNKSKSGRFTPGTSIPITSHEEVKKMNPNYLLVLPWHFRKSIIEIEKKYLRSGGTLVFPLPELELYTIKTQ